LFEPDAAQLTGERAGSAADASRVFTVPPGRAFLDAIAAAILNGDLPAAGGKPPEPLALPTYTLLLPTRRAARALQEAFLTRAGGRAMLLPAIRPISQGEEDLSLMAGLAEGATAAGSLELAPAVTPIERRLVLTMLVQRWSQTLRHGDDAAAHLSGQAVAAGAGTPAQAAHLAAELARLMDMVETEKPGEPVLDRLAELVPEELSEHWQQTIDFLKIITEMWPAYLESQALVSPAAQRNGAILAEAERLSANAPEGPVIVAGVTGSIPATVELMRVVAALPNGAIVLPALDTHLDDASWAEIAPDHPEHPQFGLKTLLDRLGIGRADVQLLAGSASEPEQGVRDALIAEAMRPSGSTGRWHSYAKNADRDAVRASLSGVSLIEAPSAQDEAEVVALILREAAETPGRTAALVSPDRLLARRVAVRLEAWGIKVDDSAGRPFAKTVPGTFLDLTIAAITNGFAPADTMALLKHPLTRVGLDAFGVRRAARALDIAVFRDIYLGQGLIGIARALDRAEEQALARERRQRAVQRLWPEDWKGAHELVARLTAAFEPLTEIFAERGEQTLQSIAAAHVAAAEALAQLPEAESEDGRSPLWRDEAGTSASNFFSGLIDPTLPPLMVKPGDYADLYRSLITGENVRPRVAVHPRLFIWGPFEARLQQTDVMILGSLNDGTWPETADPGPWLNRPMRERLGLPSPEEEIGRAAHDFTSFLGADKVYLTRAQKIDGVPTVPSRWLMRLQALLGGLELGDALRPDMPWLGWARSRAAVARLPAMKAPEPKPPVNLRPRKMSVTRIETWLANPYAIFAQDILKLDKLPELGADPDAALRGSVVHGIMKAFANRFPDTLPESAEDDLNAIAREVLMPYGEHPRIAAFWGPRFARFAKWFAETEPARRAGVARTIAEVMGSLVIAAPGGPFILSARADRIDEGEAGLIITDYKTGTPPTDTAVRSGQSPQLPLEAAIAAGKTGFTGVNGGNVAKLRYIRAAGGEPPGEERDVKMDDISVHAATAIERLAALIASYDDEATPYKALRRPRFSYDYDDYAHLARVAEWSGTEEEDEQP
jgi:ATP-dependent helicase/nuclease subunit B